jgi:hypothetical protein
MAFIFVKDKNFNRWWLIFILRAGVALQRFSVHEFLQASGRAERLQIFTD